MTLADFPKLRALSTREKLELVQALWLEVAHDLASLEVDAEEKKTLDKRWALFLRNPQSARTREHFQRELAALRK
jgi:putative addiction module component (TIGR02574 family)